LNALPAEAAWLQAADDARKAPPPVEVAQQARYGIVIDYGDMLLARVITNEDDFRLYIQDCAARGITDLVFRVSEAGNFVYRTQLEQRAFYDDAPATTVLQAFDPLAALVRYGHAVGLKIHVWNTLFDEGYHPTMGGTWVRSIVVPQSPWGRYSLFAREHPEFLWRHQDGRVMGHCLSYAYPEVRRYRIDLLQEQMDYGIDGIILDLARGTISGRHLRSGQLPSDGL
jgi:uncharacterized lipoprotein YddW (UPF0748 family)